MLMCASLAACTGGNGDQPGATPPATVPTAAPRLTAADFCAGATEQLPASTVANPDLIEISGLAASRTQDVIWAHNDSGDTARVFAIAPNGDTLATYELVGAEAFDWEDMALGPGPDGGEQYLYFADIGDNASIRPSVTVYRGLEPTFGALNSTLTIDPHEALVLRYPDGAHDAETLLLDPVSADVYVVTKDISGGPSGVYRASATGAVPATLEKVAEIDFAALAPAKVIPPDGGALPTALGRIPTGGDISPDGDIIAIRTYATVWLWQRPEGGSIADAFSTPPCEAPSAVEAQGESLAFEADGRGYFTASEGLNVDLNRFRLAIP
jgi:hypothetical protein